MQMEIEKLEANSYCIDYSEGQFFIGLAVKDEENSEIDLKGYMYCDEENFKEFFREMLRQVAKYNSINKKNLVEELFNDIKGECE